MQFTETFPHNGHCVWSPDGRHLAAVSISRASITSPALLPLIHRVPFACVPLSQTDKICVTIRHASTLRVHCTFTTDPSPIAALHWSPDSQYVLVVHLTTKCLQVFSLQSPSFLCRIDESLFGLSSARFSPDSRHVVTTSAFALRLTVHSLVTGQSYHIRRPKHSTTANRFSPDGRLLVVAERHACVDHLGLYDAASWTLIHHLPLDPTSDLLDAAWSPDSLAVAVWQGVLEAAVDVWAVDGRRLAQWRGDEGGLGISVVQWSNDGMFLVLGGYDDRVRVLHAGTWKLIADWRVEDRVRGKAVAVYRERRSEDVQADAAADKENSVDSSGDGLNDSTLSDHSKEEAKTDPSAKLAHTRTLSTLVTTATAGAGRSAKHRSTRSISAARPLPSGGSLSTRGPLSSANQSTVRGVRSLSMSSDALRKAGATSSAVPTQFVVVPSPFTLPAPALPIASAPTRASSALPPAPAIGVSQLAFSLSSSFLAVSSLSLPSAVFLYHLPSLSLRAVLTLIAPVDDASWTRDEDGTEALLITCKGGLTKLFVWRESGAGVVEVPTEGFAVRKAAWAEGGRGAVCLMDKTKFCCVFTSKEISAAEQQI